MLGQKQILFLGLLLLGLVARAEEPDTCSPVDFSEKMGPVRNQGSKGWCYAFTAADLIGYKLGLTPSRMVSAFDVGVGYYIGERTSSNTERSNDYIESQKDREEEKFGEPLADRHGGFADEAIEAYNLRGGVCLESQLPSQKSQVFLDANTYLDSVMAQKETELGRRPLASRGGPYGAGKICTDESDFGLSKHFLQRLSEINQPLQEEAAKKTAEYFSKQCGERLPMAPLKPQMMHFIGLKRRTKALEVLDNNLLNSVPTGISYSSCFLTEEEPPSFLLRKGKSCPHASSVVGRKKDPVTGKCEYKIRNSWGTSCEGYVKRLKPKCEGGHIWVTRDELSLYLKSIEWLPE